MRDVVTGFYIDVLERLIRAGTLSKSDSVLVVCGGPLDEKVLENVGFSNVVVTNIDDTASHVHQDAENLAYDDGSFDLVVVHAGLHHCYSPHRALLEMYRVARKCALAFESRDSFLMRLAVRLGLTLDYEVSSVADGKGGVAETGIPNFIYRWTEREIIKTVASFDPVRSPTTHFFMTCGCRSSGFRNPAEQRYEPRPYFLSHWAGFSRGSRQNSAMNSLSQLPRPAKGTRGSDNPHDVVANNRRLHVIVCVAAASVGVHRD